jgi:hypothetical protein
MHQISLSLVKFVPLRIGITIAAILSGVVAGQIEANAKQPLLLASTAANEAGIDPIITGDKLSPEQYADWQARKAKYDQCGLCGEMQPYPGDNGN